jgi:hypothetical protein
MRHVLREGAAGSPWSAREPHEAHRPLHATARHDAGDPFGRAPQTPLRLPKHVRHRCATPRVALRTAFRPSLTDADGAKNIGREQAVLYAALKAQGNPVSLTEVPRADHMTVGMSGMPVLIAAVAEAAGR